MFEKKNRVNVTAKQKAATKVPCGCRRVFDSCSIILYEKAVNKLEMDYYSDQIISLHALLFNENIYGG